MDDPLRWSADDQDRALAAIASWYQLDFGPIVDDIEMYQTLIEPMSNVLELGAGTGRIARPLAAHGCHVTAIEPSDHMLADAELAMRDAQIDVIRADMRCFDLNRRFDAIIIGLSTFQHLLRREDQLAALRCAQRHLTETGRLIIDWTAPRPDDVEPVAQTFHLEWVRRTDEGDTVTKLAAQELALDRTIGCPLDRASPIAWITYQYDRVSKDGDLKRALARFPLRVNLNAGEMAGLLSQSRLRETNWFSSWQLDEPGIGERLIVVAEQAS